MDLPPGLSPELRDIASRCQAFLANAAAREWAVSRVAPDEPGVEYHTGFAAGRQAGEINGLALALSMLVDRPVHTLVGEARAQASVDAAFPFELHFERADPRESP